MATDSLYVRSTLDAIKLSIATLLDEGRVVERSSGPWCMTDKSSTLMTELQNVTIEVTNPYRRWNTLLSRGMLVETADFILGLNPGFIPAWYPYYEKKVALTGKLPYTYGERIRGGEIDQWKAVVKLLKLNPTTRHATILMHRVIDRTRDYVPCTFAWHFQTNNKGELDMTTMMRSQDAFKGLPGDLFAFTLFHELMAAEVGLSIGSYNHFCCNLHLYESDIEKAEKKIKKVKETDTFRFVSILTPDRLFKLYNGVFNATIDGIDKHLKLKELDHFMKVNESFWTSYIKLIRGSYRDVK